MEKFLGVLFCGGKGTRLGELTRFISKSFIPVYDRPVFRYGLESLEKSTLLSGILILANEGNYKELERLGYETIIQDDDLVKDMSTGWEFIKKIKKTEYNGVLVPSDNVSDVNIDAMIKQFQNSDAEIVFSIKEIEREKLSKMGCFDTVNNKFYYKHPSPPSKWGVIAPYVVNGNIDMSGGDSVFNNCRLRAVVHQGFWFDIGDYDSIVDASKFIREYRSNVQV